MSSLIRRANETNYRMLSVVYKIIVSFVYSCALGHWISKTMVIDLYIV